MQPLSLISRRLYFYSFIFIFIVAVPLLILYALGWRFDDRLALIPTGGLYIATDISGAEIFLNAEPVRETGAFRKAFFIQDLAEGTFQVEVTKLGFHSWKKELHVEKHVVTEATAFMIPVAPNILEIARYSELLTPLATTTLALNPQYVLIVDMFDLVATTSTTVLSKKPVKKPIVPAVSTRKGGVATNTIATTPAVLEVATTTIEQRGVAVHEDAGGLVAVWLKSMSDVPYFFCELHTVCADHIRIETDTHTVTHFDFYAGRNDIVIIARDDGVFVTEIDPRGGQNSQPLYPTAGADFRIGSNGEIYIRDGEKIFEITL